MKERSGVEVRLTVIAVAVAAALGSPARADERDDEIARLKTPDSSVSAGIGHVGENNTRFGQYTGMVDTGNYLLFDANVNQRDENGLWTTLQGRNLGLPSRSLRFGQSKQGDWGYFIEYDQIPRFSPYTAVTRLTGEDSTRQNVTGAATPRELEISTERRRLDLGFDKLVSREIDIQVRFRNEEKDGRRLFGRTGSNAGADFLTDPINYTTQIIEATAGYTAGKLQLSGGYYGTHFNNQNTKIDVTGGNGTFTPIALPPANQSHQMHLGGGYGFTPTTRGTFKLAYTQQTQTENFIDTPSTGVGRKDLGGQVNTTLVQLGLSSRPLTGLSLLANFRRENRNDTTPVVDYFTITLPTTAAGENEPRSIRTTAAKLEASYQLPWRLRATAGIDYEEKFRNTSDVRVVSFREKTDETAARLELRRAMSETLSGSLGVIVSERGGSPWLRTLRTDGSNGSNLVHPLHLADRHRDKVRATAAWAPTDRFDLQVMGDVSRDTYGGRTLGLQDGSAGFVSTDASYRLSETWSAFAWVSHEDTRALLRSCEAAAASNTGAIAACPGTAADPRWSARLRNVGNALGTGVKGRVTGQISVNADVQLHQDRAEFRQSPTVAGVTPAPDSQYTRTILRLGGNYAVTKKSGIRAQYIRDRFRTNDWTWDNFVYAGGTTIQPHKNQLVHFVGLTGYYDF
jgi:MtrB/PioB family decaheme-associated outer membrane protein